MQKCTTFVFTSFLVFLSSIGYCDIRLIIKLKPTTNEASLLSQKKITIQQINDRLYKTKININTLKFISAISGASEVKEVNVIGNGAHVVKLTGNFSDIVVQKTIDSLKRNANIDYVEIDQKVRPSAALPNPNQWDMVNNFNFRGATWYGDNFQRGWPRSTGANVVVAVLDTGYTPHTSLLPSLQSLGGAAPECSSKNGYNNICYGYQFISDCNIAGDCDVNPYALPKADALDLGDYCEPDGTSSSWHGTHVAGDIVGIGYNSEAQTGIVGGAYGAKLLPVRVIGRCGGYLSDIVNGIYWAANQLPDVAINNTPAKVANISLIANGSCERSMQDAIDAANRSHMIVVVSAGNDAKNIDNFQPASCNGVIVVSARGPLKELSGYSDWGNTSITASGGNYINFFQSQIYSSVWGSVTSYSYEDKPNYNFYQGTSMAAPHVTAAVADILSINPNADLNKVLQTLQNSADRLSSNCNMGQSIKGPGGCVPSLSMNVANAIDYANTNNHGLGTLVSTQSSYAFHTVNEPININFFNNQPTPVYVNDIQLSDNSVFSLVSSNCVNSYTSLFFTCNVKVVQNALSNNHVLLRLLNSNRVVSTVTLIPTSTNIPPLPEADSSNDKAKSGGCAMVQGSEDLSLLLILLFWANFYIIKRTKFWIKK